jgi:hypothetical protein
MTATLMTRAVLRQLLACCALLALAGTPAHSQQTTGVPGSPSATTTIDGKQLPPPDPKFGGVIERPVQLRISGLVSVSTCC